jgi:predicted amidohydrolase
MTSTNANASNRGAVRVGCVQWRMRPFSSADEFLQQVELQARALASYKCDIALFPEFFSVPLTGLWPQLETLDAMRELAKLTPELVQKIARFASAHRINIVAGSMPLVENGKLFNVSCLCRRDGRVEVQYKLHPTPGEVSDWQMQGGQALRTFDTDFGRIGILICYDVEFPELPRILAEQGIDVLFVPFWTDSKAGYLRVRLCAQARAIENECYVVLAGSVGCMPEISCLDNQYAQSAVFAPSDIGFPHDAIVAEATPNIETSLIADLDLARLRHLRVAGSVRNASDRRRDLYKVEWIGKK